MYEFFIDLETTGVDPQKNGIHQFAGIIREPKIDTPQTVEYKIKPFESDIIDKEALEVSGITPKDIESYGAPSDFKVNLEREMEKFISRYNKTQKFHFIGYNAKFDMDFLRAFYSKSGDNYFGSWFWFPYLDVMNMAAVHFKERRPEIKNFKLFNIASEFGITVDESRLHDATYDIELTMEMYDIIEREK